MAESLQQLLVTNFGLSPSGYTGSQGAAGYTGSSGTNGYTGSAGAAGSGILISNIQVTDSGYTVLDDTAVDTAGGYIKITGSGFAAGCTVLINQTAATSVTFISSTEVRAQVPATAAGTYIVYLVNTSGDVAIRVNGITFSATPTWVTASSLAGIVNNAISIQLSANSATTYGLQAGSTLPSGVTLSNVGLISGTISDISSETTYNFTVVATDAELQDSPRSFALTISVGDVYFKNTTLLLSGNGSMIGNTAVRPFTSDVSTNNFNVVAVGDTRADEFDPYQAGYYSAYFDGTGDYLTIPRSNLLIPVANENFTIESWVYLTQAVDQQIVGFHTQGVSSDWLISISSTNYPSFYISATATTMTSTIAVQLNTWNHIAVVRTNTNTITLYVNGVAGATTTTTSTMVGNGSNPLTIGSDYNGVNWRYIGYISNLRIVKGTAVYTANFTPSTTPLTAIANTVLLTCQSNRLIDNSANAFAITKNGDTAVRASHPFVLPSNLTTYGSAYFDGTGDYLTIPSSSVFDMWANNVTVECWVYFNSIANVPHLWSIGPDVSNRVTVYSVSGTIRLFTNTADRITSSTITAGVWYHVALTKSSGTWTLWLNGVSQGTSATTSYPSGSAASVGVGFQHFGTPSAGDYLNGYISDLRVVKGTAVYTTAFSLPSAPLTAIANTALLVAQYNGAGNNNGFRDSGPNNFTITRVGNTTQGTFSPYGGNWSSYFDGTGDYLAATSPGMSGTWTVELWWYPIVGATQQTIVAFNAGSAGSLAINIWMNTSNQLVVDNGQVASGLFTGGTFTINAWNHVAVVRNGTTTTGYINGVAVGSNTFTPGSVNNINIGRYPDGNLTTFYYASGYISDLRVVVGTAVYTSAFTPPTTQLTAISGTSLLTCQNNRFIDNSSNNYTITRNGDAKIQRFSPFRPSAGYSTSTIGGSGLFDGSGDYLTIPSNPAFQVTGDFTIEAYVYATSLGTWNNILSQYVNNTNLFACGYNPSSGWYFNYANNTTEVANSRAGLSPLNAWTHVAFVKSGTTMTVYVNGTALGSTITVPNLPLFSGALHIGIWAGALVDPWIGYISNLRIVKGTAVYTTNFTPPTAPVTAVANTSLLCNFTHAGVVDGTMLNDLETVGGVQISTAQSKFGGSSMYFDGNGDYLSIAASPNTTLGAGDFTIEMWIYSGANGTATRVMTNIPQGASPAWISGRWVIATSTAGNPNKFIFACNNYANNADMLVSSVAANDSAWHHYAVTRSGNTWRLFIDGVLQQTITSSVSLDNNTPSTFNIGTESSSFWAGYIDDLRITKGVARYTASFTAPTAPFLAQ